MRLIFLIILSWSWLSCESSESDTPNETDPTTDPVVSNDQPEESSDTEAPLNISGFTATSDGLGAAVLSLDFPEDVSDYSQVYLRYERDSTLPPENCESGELLDVASIADGVVRVYTTTPGQSLTARLCLEDAAGNVNSDMTASVVTSDVQRVFTSSAKYDGNFQADFNGESFTTGREGAHARCQYLADNASPRLEGTWIALIADSSVDGLAYPSYGELQNKNGVKLEDSLSAAFIASRIIAATSAHIDENGNTLVDEFAWSGLQGSGSSYTSHCTNWSTTSGSGALGEPYESTAWVDAGGAFTCNNTFHLLCIEIVGSAP